MSLGLDLSILFRNHQGLFLLERADENCRHWRWHWSAGPAEWTEKAPTRTGKNRSTITAIVTVSDNGGLDRHIAAGLFRHAGDGETSATCLVALADADRLLTLMCQHRFEVTDGARRPFSWKSDPFGSLSKCRVISQSAVQLGLRPSTARGASGLPVYRDSP